MNLIRSISHLPERKQTIGINPIILPDALHIQFDSLYDLLWLICLWNQIIFVLNPMLKKQLAIMFNSTDYSRRSIIMMELLLDYLSRKRCSTFISCGYFTDNKQVLPFVYKLLSHDKRMIILEWKSVGHVFVNTLCRPYVEEILLLETYF